MEFIKGMKLSERYYREVVYKILKNKRINLKYSAGLIGPGSEVLGFDTPRSMDHDWGPRVTIFIKEEDLEKKEEIQEILQKELPEEFLGYPTNFRKVGKDGIRVMSKLEKRKKLNHGVAIITIKRFFKEYLGISPYKQISNRDWLVFSEQKLRTIRSGLLFHDDLGIKEIKERLQYYPKDIWLYLLLSEWSKISQEESFMGRCGEVGDELGSRIISVRIIKSVMNLMFLMEQEYIPYSKWYGTAFSGLQNSKEIEPIFNKILDSKKWEERETEMSEMYNFIGRLHNELKITDEISPEIRHFHDRPFKILDASRYVKAIKDEIEDTEILEIKADIGSINQITKTVDILEDNELIRKMARIYK